MLTVECVSEWMCRSVRNPRVFWIFRVVTSQSPFHSTFQESQKKMVALLKERSALPPPLAPWYDEPDDDDIVASDEEEPTPDATQASRPEPNENESKWSSNIWRLWNPEGTATMDLPPVAIAALADSLAAAGQPPSIIIADLRDELAEGIASGIIASNRAATEEAAIAKLEAELCGGAVAVDKCCKCRVRGRDACMVGCGHRTLCTACATSVTKHVNGHGQRSRHLARLMCPVCRGFEHEDGASAASVFSMIDRDGNGVIDTSELLMHLLVSGQEPETITELFAGLDTDSDGVISKEEFDAGFQRFMGVAASPAAKKLPPLAEGEARSGGEEAVDAEAGAAAATTSEIAPAEADPNRGAVSSTPPAPA